MSDRDDAVDVAWNPARDPAWTPRRGLEDQARALHHALEGYAPTPLHAAPTLAAELGLGAVLLKDESSRFGLPAFKALGAWWATAWAVADRLGAPALATEPEALRDRARGAPLTLVCATEGNHGRAVARAARWLGLEARVVVPEAHRRRRACRPSRPRARGSSTSTATTTPPSGAPPSLADDRHLVIADTSWPGYEEVPRRVVEGYATIFAELDAQLDGRTRGPRRRARSAWARWPPRPPATSARRRASARGWSGLEPIDAACALASARAGHPVTVDGELRLDHGRPELPDAVDGRLAAARRRLRRLLRRRRRSRAARGCGGWRPRASTAAAAPAASSAG